MSQRFERKIAFVPAFDKRDLDPRKNYGVHGAEIRFTLRDTETKDVLCFVLYTNWMTRDVQVETDARYPGGSFPYMFHKPQPAGCDLHLAKKPNVDYASYREHCELTGGECWCDGTAITDDLFYTLVEQGEEAFWAFMEKRMDEWRADK